MSMDNKIKPEWTPENAGSEYASYVKQGVNKDELKKPKRRKDKTKMSVDELIEGIRKGNLTALGRAITLIESNSRLHKQEASHILDTILPLTGNSIRIGITGSPGVGKSTFIEAFGSMLCNSGHKVAVLAIDPSSTRSGGSILGDKTRMEDLSRNTNAFIRPSPSGGSLGGVARKTRETLLICEAAGYDIIIIETVGVGQNEVTVRSIVDFFLLMLLPGAGDDLQGIKKGVVELSDALVINKADGDKLKTANETLREYKNAISLLLPATKGWKTEVMMTSAINNQGVKEVWDMIKKFKDTVSSDRFLLRRKEQNIEWMHNLIIEKLKSDFLEDSNISTIISDLEDQIMNDKITPSSAIEKLFKVK